MKRWIATLLICCLCVGLCACGTSAKKANFTAESVTVYDLCEGWGREITDSDSLAELAALDASQWTALKDPSKQVSACAVYAMDFGNGTVIGYLGDGYIQLGTAFEWLDEEHMSYRISDSVQYQVPQSVTELLWEIITEE